MGRLTQFLLFVFHYQIVVSSFLITARSLCPKGQSLLLWNFKQSLSIDSMASLYECDYYGQPSYPKTASWNLSTDCCLWDGVTCDRFSGEVIGLDLSCSQIQGVVDSNSTLFQLFHLQTLNLACNDLSSSVISSNFSRLQRLTHLNLSYSGFSGQLPVEFLRLINLISLDLTYSSTNLTIQPHIFQLLLQNSTQLREVLLIGSNIDSVMPRNLSTSLRILNLWGTHLFGELPGEVFQLPKLQILQLSYNVNLTGDLLKVEWNTSSPLSYLDLSGTDFSGKLPESLGNLKALYYLDLSFCYFSGSIPVSFGNFTQMTTLALLENNLTGQVPSSLANLEQLTTLELSSNNLGGQVPNFFSKFKNLVRLILSNNHFNGYFPSSLINLTKLETLYLSGNSLTGPLPPNISGFQNLIELHLGDNTLNGTIPSWIFSLPSLNYLQMESNQFSGQLYEFQYQSLQAIYLTGNRLHGPIPSSISKLVNLTILDLSHNNFSGDVEVNLFSNLKQLSQLILSSNSISLINNGMNSTLPPSLRTLQLSSCGIRIKDLDFLTGVNNMLELDLSDNMLQGQMFMDLKSYSWAQSLHLLNLSFNFLTDIHQLPTPDLNYLDVRSNLLSGSLIVPSVKTVLFLASDNNFTGEIPSSICNLSMLQMLDLSNNNLSGTLPQCLGNMSIQLSAIDLHSNNFHGIIPSNFPVGSQLVEMNLRDNMLEGAIPLSLSNCRELEVLDIGNNVLNGTFPSWLGTLPKLQVLSLRANHLSGPLSMSETGSSFPALRILDLSRNDLTGILPTRFFTQLKGMIRFITVNPVKKRFQLYKLYYLDSLVTTRKGIEIEVVRVLSILTTIDLSSNNFEGSIPDAIGNLIALEGLNLSHNMFGGQIPPTLETLTSLEFLDLSSNQITGVIPQQLTALTYLSVLNLSENHLTGSIPQGNQFNTFDNTSYLGNDGLCGFPLSRTCGSNELGPPTSSTTAAWNEKESEDFIDGFTWRAVLIGYGSGMLAGVIMGCLSFITGKPKWFNKAVEQECSRLVKKKWPKEVKWLPKEGVRRRR